jgi:hypothetical protein
MKITSSPSEQEGNGSDACLLPLIHVIQTVTAAMQLTRADLVNRNSCYGIYTSTSRSLSGEQSRCSLHYLPPLPQHHHFHHTALISALEPPSQPAIIVGKRTYLLSRNQPTPATPRYDSPSIDRSRSSPPYPLTQPRSRKKIPLFHPRGKSTCSKRSCIRMALSFPRRAAQVLRAPARGTVLTRHQICGRDTKQNLVMRWCPDILSFARYDTDLTRSIVAPNTLATTSMMNTTFMATALSMLTLA